MRSRYAAASAVLVTGGLRLGITTARANTRAVWGSTLASVAPSRRCRWASSGRVSVRDCTESGSPGGRSARELQSARVHCVLLRSGELAGELHRVRKRQLREERSEHALPVELRAFASGRSALRDQHELTALPVGVLAEPGRRFAETAPVDLLEEFRQLTRDHEEALGAQRPRHVLDAFDDAVRRLVEHERVRQHAKSLERPAPRALLC